MTLDIVKLHLSSGTFCSVLGLFTSTAHMLFDSGFCCVFSEENVNYKRAGRNLFMEKCA